MSLRQTAHVTRIWSAVEYRDMAETLIRLVKYDHYWSYTEIMVELIVLCLEPELTAQKIDFLVPVPLTPARKRWRGFNQAEHLANHLGRRLKIPVETHALRREGKRRNQAKLNKQEREQLQHDFLARPRFLAGKTVCLVDDVTTTGSTLEACGAALHEEEVKTVYAVTFAAA